MSTTTLLFKEMLREEWNLHTSLFGTYRFAAFPVFIALLTLAGVSLLMTTGVSLTPIILALHIMVGLFGLQTGSLVFIGSDAMRNVLGDNTYLVFSARTLPLSQKHLLGVFLIKDLVYYAFLFILPITLGFAPFILGSGALSAAQLLILWLALAMTFMTGVALTMISVSLGTYVTFGKPLLLTLVTGAIALALYGVPLEMFTPYYLFENPSVKAAVTAIPPTLGALAVAVYLFTPQRETPTETESDVYTPLRKSVLHPDPLPTKMLIDLLRSSGGVYKVFFSAGLLLAVTWFLLDLATDIIGFTPDAGLAYGSLLSLTAFTTYNWITQTDAPEEYLFYPLEIVDVFNAKFITFSYLTLPVGLVFYGGVVAYEGTTLASALIGALVFLGLSVYMFAVTVYLAGFDPNEFLFDTLLFMGFTVLVVAALLPVVLSAFLISAPGFPLESTALYLWIAVEMGIAIAISIGLFKKAPAKWTHELKN